MMSIQNRTVRYGLVFALCLLGVIAVDLMTNDLNTTRYYWDFAIYYDMAEHGLTGNDELIAPFVYRLLTPLLAGAIADVLPLDHRLDVLASGQGEMFVTSTYPGFKVVAYVGAVAQLCAVFLLAEHVGLRFRHALTVTAVVGLSLYNLKFLIFDVSRPDHLAYPLMAVAALALFRRNLVLVLVASCVGLLVREFLIIPPAILFVMLFRDYVNDRSRTTLAWMGVTFGAVSLFVIVPRAAIPITESGQYLDPINDASTLSRLIEAPTSERRDFNVLFNVTSYALPVWLLLTVGRARRVWARLAGYRLFLFLYTGLVLVLTMYGGTDIWRFVSYLFIPQVMLLAALFKDDDVQGIEILVMLVAVAIYNRILVDIPNWVEQYLDFYGGYDNRVNLATVRRIVELATYLLGANFVRILLLEKPEAATPDLTGGSADQDVGTE